MELALVQVVFSSRSISACRHEARGGPVGLPHLVVGMSTATNHTIGRQKSSIRRMLCEDQRGSVSLTTQRRFRGDRRRKEKKLRKLRLLAAMLAMAAVMVASAVSPATAEHWDWYDDEWGVCGWEWTPVWPHWEYGCHDFGPFWSPLWSGFDAWDDDDDDDDDDWDDDDDRDHWDDQW